MSPGNGICPHAPCIFEDTGDNGVLSIQGGIMAEKLGIGAAVPSLTLNLVGGGTANVPDLTDAKYQLVLFYRGHW